MTMGLYLTRLVGARVLAVLAGFLVLGLTFDIAETSNEIVDDHGLAGLAEYAMLRAPVILLTIMPLGILTGAVLAFLTLAARSEMVVVRATGLNTLRVVGLLVPLALVLGVFQNQLATRIGPWAEQALVLRFPALFEGEAIEEEVWLRDWEAIVRIGGATADATELRDVSIFETAPSGELLRRIDAARARYLGEDWRLTDVTVQRVRRGPEPLESMIWHTRLTPAGILGAARRPDLIAAEDVRRILAGEKPAARGTPYYLVQLWRSYAALAVPTVMMLFAALASFGLARSGGGARFVGLGVAMGAGFVLVDGVFTSLGQVGAMQASLAALVAPAVFLVAGVWTIVVIEE